MRYSKVVLDYFADRRYSGCFLAETAHIGSGEVGTLSNGDVIHLQIKVSPESLIIQDLRFQALGGVATIASCAWVAEWLIGRSLSDGKSLTINTLLTVLELPTTKQHCAFLVQQAVSKAIAHYYEAYSENI